MPDVTEFGLEEKLASLSTLQSSSEEDEGERVDEVEDRDEEYEEEEEEEDEDVSMTIGFVEKPEDARLLLRQMFPSKAGGVPAWLNPDDLPSREEHVCDICREPLQFLLQVYAPTNKESTFHRILYVFMCPSMSCLLQDQHEQWKRKPEKPSRSVKVFRSQMPRKNPFYSSDSPKRDGTAKPLSDGALLCSWCCSWKGDKVCTGCREARYCSEKHQVLHWGLRHKHDCSRLIISCQSSHPTHDKIKSSNSELNKVPSCSLWPEFEIVDENESVFNEELPESSSSANSLIPKDRIDDNFSLLDNFEGDNDRRSWASFQQRIGKAPKQVLRYSTDPKARPLWPMSSGRASKADIPRCSYCGGSLRFEFQVLPQLLYYFGVKNDADSLDWATIVVYTCVNSCDGNPSYKEEFAWVQLASS